MKIIEALKMLKSLEKKADDIRGLIKKYCCDMSYEEPAYENQKLKVSGWIQAYRDLLREISDLSFRLQRTNVMTMVEIEIDGKVVKKSIAEWIMRRRKLCPMELAMWDDVGDNNLREGIFRLSTGDVKEARVRRYYDVEERDKRRASLSNEPFLIDGKLEIVNAITDLVN